MNARVLIRRQNTRKFRGEYTTDAPYDDGRAFIHQMRFEEAENRARWVE